MPFVNPPVCFLCKKVHSCDTKDTVQLVAPDGDTVNICKDHPGVMDEYNRQNNLSSEDAAVLARKALAHPRSQRMMDKIRADMRQREEAFLSKMLSEGKGEEAMEILYGWKN